jgi:hypothetical protein
MFKSSQATQALPVIKGISGLLGLLLVHTMLEALKRLQRLAPNQRDLRPMQTALPLKLLQQSDSLQASSCTLVLTKFTFTAHA